MIAVIIATLNRPELLKNLLHQLSSQTLKPSQIIIIDASNEENRVPIDKIEDEKIIYKISKVKSAALQRNQALELVDKETEFIAVLDDDIIIEPDYLDRCFKLIKNTNAVGVSGVAIPIIHREKSKNFFVKKFFLFESKKGGVITLSGINIPVKESNKNGTVHKTEWLIGCSFWRYKDIQDLKYCELFLGNSLFEDVIFSMQANKKGNLYVDSTIVLNHLESAISRPNVQEFYSMWIVNRYQVIRNLDAGYKKYLAYHWSNFGKLVQLISYG